MVFAGINFGLAFHRLAQPQPGSLQHETRKCACICWALARGGVSLTAWYLLGRSTQHAVADSRFRHGLFQAVSITTTTGFTTTDFSLVAFGGAHSADASPPSPEAAPAPPPAA